jgi:hypothetical protein
MLKSLISLFSAKPKKSTIPARVSRGGRMFDRPISSNALRHGAAR